MSRLTTSTACAVVLSAAGLMQASAEIADVEVGPGGVYVSIEGGFQGVNGSDVAAHGEISGAQSRDTGGYAGAFGSAGYYSGVSTAQALAVGVATQGTVVTASHATSPPPQATTSAQLGNVAQSASSKGGNFIAADDGYYTGFSAGYVFSQPLFGFFQRVEMHGSFGGNSASQSVAGAASGLSVDGRTAFASVSQGAPLAVATYVKQQLNEDEIVLRLKTGNMAGVGSLAIFASVEPFYRYLNQDTAMAAHVPLAAYMDIPFPTLAYRDASVTGNFYGAQLAFEASYPLAAGVSWIGRASAGAYVLEAHANFSDNFGKMKFIMDSMQSGGLRLGAESGFRFAVSPGVWLSATGSVDYLSDVPTPLLPRYTTELPAHIGLDDLTVYKATGRLTFVIH